MNPKKLNTIPRVYTMSFEDNCLILTIHPNFGHDSGLVTESRINAHVQETIFRNTTCATTHSFDARKETFGINDVFVRLPDTKDGFCRFGTKKFSNQCAISATLHVFFTLAELHVINTDIMPSIHTQSFAVDTRFNSGNNSGCQIFGNCSDGFSKTIERLNEQALEEIHTAMLVGTQHPTNKRWLGQKPLLHNGILQITLEAGNGVWLTIGKGEIAGHNIDRIAQQIPLMCALAKVCEIADKT